MFLEVLLYVFMLFDDHPFICFQGADPALVSTLEEGVMEEFGILVSLF
jgi:hypothetical protein